MDTMSNSTGTGTDNMYAFMVDPLSTWTLAQAILFPILFVIPAEILGGLSDFTIWLLTDVMGRKPLPKLKDPDLSITPDIQYIAFNRLFVLPFLSLLIVKGVWASNAILYQAEEATIWNTLVAFLVVFSLSDLTYYTGHRIVHKVPMLYKFVHKHHHQESQPRRGWADTCNAHPTDFFYTGFCTCPLSVLWMMPEGSVHIYAIAACLYINAFAGAFGHCRLDFNIGVFNTRFHAGHHLLTKCNYAQNIELWDRLFGTFRHLPAVKGEKGHKDTVKAE